VGHSKLPFRRECFGIQAVDPRQKFKLAFDDSFDPTAFLVAGVFAGSAMVQHQYPSFGQGAAGFGKYYGGAFADQTIGNMMTEAVLPIKMLATSLRERRISETDQLRH
jgi:hypothetical protein